MAEEAPKKRVTKKAAKKVVTKKVTRRVTRKAAPRRKVEPVRRGISFVTLAIIWLVLLGIGTGALYYGYMEEGQINVAEQMELGKGITITGEEITEEEQNALPSDSLPNGGLVPIATPEPSPEPPSVETASTTEEIASSTDAVSEEDSADSEESESDAENEEGENDEVEVEETEQVEDEQEQVSGTEEQPVTE